MNLSPLAHQVLDKIASGESSGYTDLYGGGKFHSFSKHPDVQIPLGNGLVSTAAGRYQMLKPTWEEQKHRLGLKDFSPASQDLAAWDLAQRTYRQQTGRELETDAGAGSVNWGALSNQWASLKSGVQAKAAGWGPGVTRIAASPQLAGLGENPLGLPAGPQVTPVAHDPFQPLDSPFLRQVDYNPFQTKAPTP